MNALPCKRLGEQENIVSNSTFGEFKSSADKDDFHKHQGRGQNPEETARISKGSQIKCCREP
jgi:hypothetical protein